MAKTKAAAPGLPAPKVDEAGAASLRAIDGAADPNLTPDHDRAAAALSGDPLADDPDGDDRTEPQEPTERPTGRRGPKPGTGGRPRKDRAAGAPSRPSGPKHRERLADVIEERDRLRAMIDTAGSDPALIEQAAERIAAVFEVAGEIAAENVSPAWKLSQAQCEKLGAVWAPILAPKMAVLGASAPYVLAAIATGSVLMPNWREHRRLQEEAAREILIEKPPTPGVTEGGNG